MNDDQKAVPLCNCAQRIAELEKENLSLRVLIGDLHPCRTGDCPHEKRTECDEELSKIKANCIPREDVEGLVRALEDYADRMNYNCGDYPYPWIYTDNGNTALNALTEFKAKHGGGNG